MYVCVCGMCIVFSKQCVEDICMMCMWCVCGEWVKCLCGIHGSCEVRVCNICLCFRCRSGEVLWYMCHICVYICSVCGVCVVYM